MTDTEKPELSARKAPRQERSSRLVDDILEAAARVLAEHGAHRFTTARVAERAGVSVGSLYQYFPNKASILFRLQTDEWQRNVALLIGIIEDRSRPPMERLRNLVHAFILSEREEVELRIALDDAAPYYREAVGEDDPRIRGAEVLRAFAREVLPGVSEDRRMVAIDVIKMTLSDIGKRISEERELATRIEVYADAVADMLCAYLGRLAGNGRP